MGRNIKYTIIYLDRKEDIYIAPPGVCDEMRLSVEFVTVGFLGICRQYCCD